MPTYFMSQDNKDTKQNKQKPNNYEAKIRTHVKYLFDYSISIFFFYDDVTLYCT